MYSLARVLHPRGCRHLERKGRKMLGTISYWGQIIKEQKTSGEEKTKKSFALKYDSELQVKIRTI